MVKSLLFLVLFALAILGGYAIYNGGDVTNAVTKIEKLGKQIVE